MAPRDGDAPTPARPWWLGLAVLATGAVWLWGGLSLPQRAQYAVVGPGVVPTLVGAGLVLLGILLLVQIARGERFAPQEAEDVDVDAPVSRRAFWTAVAAAAAPVLTLPRLGFPLTAALVFLLVARAFGSPTTARDAAIGLVVGLVGWVLFSRLLGVQLPALPLVLGY